MSDWPPVETNEVYDVQRAEKTSSSVHNAVKGDERALTKAARTTGKVTGMGAWLRSTAGYD